MSHNNFKETKVSECRTFFILSSKLEERKRRRKKEETKEGRKRRKEYGQWEFYCKWLMKMFQGKCCYINTSLFPFFLFSSLSLSLLVSFSISFSSVLVLGFRDLSHHYQIFWRSRSNYRWWFLLHLPVWEVQLLEPLSSQTKRMERERESKRRERKKKIEKVHTINYSPPCFVRRLVLQKGFPVKLMFKLKRRSGERERERRERRRDRERQKGDGSTSHSPIL